MSWKILDQKKHFDLKSVIVICRMCTGKLFYKEISNKDNEYVALGKSGHFALQDRLYQDFFAGKVLAIPVICTLQP